MDWTEDMIARIRDLWAEGHSTAEIGRRMGVTKNAIVGKAHRLALPARPSPIRKMADGATRQRPPRPEIPRPTGFTSRETSGFGQRETSGFSARDVSGYAPREASGFAQRDASGFAPRPLFPSAPTRSGGEPAPSMSRDAAQQDASRAERPLFRTADAPVRSGPRVQPCCWPIGEPGTPEFRFCSADAVSGRPYCPEHVQVAYVKVRDRREDAA